LTASRSIRRRLDHQRLTRAYRSPNPADGVTAAASRVIRQAVKDSTDRRSAST